MIQHYHKLGCHWYHRFIKNHFLQAPLPVAEQRFNTQQFFCSSPLSVGLSRCGGLGVMLFHSLWRVRNPVVGDMLYSIYKLQGEPSWAITRKHSSCCTHHIGVDTAKWLSDWTRGNVSYFNITHSGHSVLRWHRCLAAKEPVLPFSPQSRPKPVTILRSLSQTKCHCRPPPSDRFLLRIFR